MTINAVLNRSRRAHRRARIVTLLVILASAAPASALPTTIGPLLVGNRFGQIPANVLSVNPTTGAVNGVWGSANNFDPSPGAMAQDSLGRVYIVDSNNNRIQRFDSQGAFIDVFATVPINGLHYGLAIDAADVVYVTSDGPQTFNIADDAIVRFSPAGTPLGAFGQATNAQSGFIAGGPLAFDAAGNLYTSGGGNITRYSPTGTFLGQFIDQFALQLAFDSSGRLYTASSDILRFAADGAPLGVFAQGFGSSGLALDGLGNVYASDLGTNRVRKYAPNGSVLATFTSASFSGPGTLLVLEPVPEPGAMALMGVVIVAGLFVKRATRRGECELPVNAART